jgi:hypothetical protein
MLIINKAEAAGVGLQLCLVLDGSSSVTATEWNTTKESIAEAVVAVVPRNSTVEITVVQFGYPSGDGYAAVEVSRTLITGSSYGTVANNIRAMTQGGGSTATVHGLYLGWKTLRGSSRFNASSRQVINLVTDGLPNVRNSNATSDLDGSGSINVKDDAIAVVTEATSQGLDELDVEAIAMKANDTDWFKNWLVQPQPGIVAPPFNKGGWIRILTNITEFKNTINQKFEVVIPEFSPMLLVPMLIIAMIPMVVICSRKKREKKLKYSLVSSSFA